MIRWPTAVVVHVVRDFTTLVESARAVIADATNSQDPRASESLGLWAMADGWQFSSRVAEARMLLSEPVDRADDWLEVEVADVARWRYDSPDAPPDDELGFEGTATLRGHDEVCVSRGTFVRLMRDLELMVVSLGHVERFTWDLGSSESAMVWAAFFREWRVFELLERDAGVLAAAFGDTIAEVLDDLPVWTADHPEPPLAVYASQGRRLPLVPSEEQ